MSTFRSLPDPVPARRSSCHRLTIAALPRHHPQGPNLPIPAGDMAAGMFTASATQMARSVVFHVTIPTANGASFAIHAPSRNAPPSGSATPPPWPNGDWRKQKFEKAMAALRAAAHNPDPRHPPSTGWRTPCHLPGKPVAVAVNMSAISSSTGIAIPAMAFARIASTIVPVAKRPRVSSGPTG